MSLWDGTKIIRFKTERYNDNWDMSDCGCCNGIRWGGDYPIECSDCNGGGFVYVHRRSGVVAEYPGGRFLGRITVEKEKNNE